MTAQRWTRICLLLFTLASAVSFAENIDELKSKLAVARPEDRPGLCIQIAHNQLRAADKAYNDGNVQQAQKSIAEVVEYSEKARDASTQSKKHLKNVEIAVRKMSERLNDIKRTLAFEDQPAVTEAVRKLEDIRTSLLNEMFKKDKK